MPNAELPGGVAMMAKRAIATAIDAVVWATIGLTVGAFACRPLGHSVFVALGIAAAFFFAVDVVLHALGGRGQSLGKLLTGIRVLGASGGPLGLGRLATRQALKWLALPLLVAVEATGFTGGDRALHDRACGTLVRRRADTPAPGAAPAGP